MVPGWLSTSCDSWFRGCEFEFHNGGRVYLKKKNLPVKLSGPGLFLLLLEGFWLLIQSILFFSISSSDSFYSLCISVNLFILPRLSIFFCIQMFIIFCFYFYKVGIVSPFSFLIWVIWIFFFKDLFVKEREGGCEQGEGQRERRERISSRLPVECRAWSPEPNRGLNSSTMRSWPEPKSRVDT